MSVSTYQDNLAGRGSKERIIRCFNPYSAGIDFKSSESDFSRQNLSSVDVRF